MWLIPVWLNLVVIRGNNNGCFVISQHNHIVKFNWGTQSIGHAKLYLNFANLLEELLPWDLVVFFFFFLFSFFPRKHTQNTDQQYPKSLVTQPALTSYRSSPKMMTNNHFCSTSKLAIEASITIQNVKVKGEKSKRKFYNQCESGNKTPAWAMFRWFDRK